MANNKIHIALVDDHTLFRNGIANLLKEFTDIEIVLEAKNGKDFIQKITANTKIDVVLMDINMPVMDGYACTEWIKENYPNIQVLALSMFEEDTAVIKMLKAGAGGYVLKESKPQDLYRAIQEIKEKGLYLNDMVTGKIIRILQQGSHTNEIHLTDREKEFMQLCATEFTYKEISAAMKIAARSADNYREVLFNKLQVKSRVGIVLYGIKNGIKVP
jgi:DNA-binding NarL/FixJ family response regulator